MLDIRGHEGHSVSICKGRVLTGKWRPDTEVVTIITFEKAPFMPWDVDMAVVSPCQHPLTVQHSAMTSGSWAMTRGSGPRSSRPPLPGTWGIASLWTRGPFPCTGPGSLRRRTERTRSWCHVIGPGSNPSTMSLPFTRPRLEEGRCERSLYYNKIKMINRCDWNCKVE